ncbi:MAG: hypothetical protein AAFY71_02535 [Bacteroidota bacterium]
MKNFRLIRPILLLLGLLSLQLVCYGYRSVNWGEWDPECLYLDLSQNWVSDEGTFYSVPFSLEETGRPLSISRTFYMDSTIQEDLILWIGRYAWEIEIILNDRYLTVEQEPFSNWFLRLEREWLKQGTNQLNIRLNTGLDKPYSPLPTLGIWEAIGLMEEDRIGEFLPSILQESPGADTVALVAPYYGGKTYDFSEVQAAKLLNSLLKHRIEDVYFWFEPDRKLLDLCQRMGIRRVRQLKDEQIVCAINAYPFAPGSHGKTYRFWRDLEGNRTFYFGEFETWGKLRSREIPKEDSNWLILFVMLPFVSLALVKLSSPAYFSSFARIWLGSGVRSESTTENLYSSIALVFILNLLKLLNQMTWLGMGLYFIQHHNMWHSFSDIFSEGSLFARFFDGQDSLISLMTKIFALLLIWQGVKFLFWSFIGKIFTINQMPSKAFSLEVLSTMPMILVMGVLWIIGLYGISSKADYLVGLMVMLSGIYVLRKLFVLYNELGSMFNFSSGMKILYICTFNVLPYLIWL